MLASLLRPRRPRIPANRSPFSSPYTTQETAPFLQRGDHPHRQVDIDNEGTHDDDSVGFSQDDDEEPNHQDEDGPEESSPLLPIFSAPHLDSLPVYNITHAIRLLVVARCETTLTWDQLRSPQVSQFLLKPIQQQIRESYFNRATLYALMANCLQFHKEVELNPGNSGTSRTRAMVCELLAIKLLKEFTTRELIDALSYDFFPLQGQSPPTTATTLRGPGWNSSQKSKPLAGVTRISCLEIAIRAQAKRFLAHPLVVQQLEAIWAGTIVFHSAADSLHRQPPQVDARIEAGYGSFNRNDPSSGFSQGKAQSGGRSQDPGRPRRSVTLYDPRDASLFKLSRLRVPRYRQFLSTCSFAVLLGLYLAVIIQRPLEINTLELVFWFWSAGFMLDEIVGFNEQGFSLYIMSFWNLFDLGILLLLFCYYCLRLYGVMMPDVRKPMVADQAYDVLAASAVLLFPRLFSVLDHYRYFSQLLIAFRIMAADLMAVFILIVVACSGFFVAFSFSFGPSNSPSAVAYALFQMLMGFTPAAWTLWDQYNTLGRIILTIFLFICHFVVVTILITVLTNSFMDIVQNANEEHQFVFAVNTISMVKSDALFSYVAPTNILAWLITPLRFIIPFRQFVRLNRTVIKITHFPILFSICLYEKTVLSSSFFEPTDLVESRTRSGAVLRARHDRQSRFDTFKLAREPSIATCQQDRILEEVFRRPFRHHPAQNIHGSPDDRRKTIMVKDWMQRVDSGPVNAPDEQDPGEVDPLESTPRRSRVLGRRRTLLGTIRDFTETTRSVASDPEEFINYNFLHPGPGDSAPNWRSPMRQLSQATDMEGDDERTSGDNNDDESGDEKQSLTRDSQNGESQTARYSGKSTPKFYSSRPSTAQLLSRRNSPTRRRPRTPRRNLSSATILYNPVDPQSGDESIQGVTPLTKSTQKLAKTNRPGATPPSPGRRTPKRNAADAKQARPVFPPRSAFMSVPDFSGVGLELGSDLGDNKAVGGGFVSAIPWSLGTQMMYPPGGLGQTAQNDDRDMLSKLVLARMNNLEEGFREVIREVKDLRQRPGNREKKKRTETKEKLGQRSRKSKSGSSGGDDGLED
ncbi:hypothetical protein VTN77DRAFT_434 [Rasamsonia byssochlamydoides]|uniref:uncharacterized protein n=1 Tax=Rasamsonia byssochlamydoides TaxID=89139 RepID=UPI003742FA5C